MIGKLQNVLQLKKICEYFLNGVYHLILFLMNLIDMKKILCILLLSTMFCTAKSQKVFDDPELLVNALYQEVTFAPGESPNWDFAKSMFLDEAVVVLRYGPNNMTVFDVQGWVDDFVTFIREDGVSKTGFDEKILGMHSYIYGDIASINVLFESHIPGTDRRNQGVDISAHKEKWKMADRINH